MAQKENTLISIVVHGKKDLALQIKRSTHLQVRLMSDISLSMLNETLNILIYSNAVVLIYKLCDK